MSRYRNILAAIAATCCISANAGYFGAGTNRNATAITYGTNAVTAVYCGSNLVWSSAPSFAYSPESDFLYRPAGTGVLISAYAGSGGVCNIPPTLGGLPVVYIGADAFNYGYNGTSNNIATLSITSMVISSGALEIGAGGCARLSGMVAVELPASMAAIGAFAFYGCAALTHVYFHGNAPTVGNDMFTESGSVVIYRRAAATGWPTVPDAFAGRPTAIWTSYPDPMP